MFKTIVYSGTSLMLGGLYTLVKLWEATDISNSININRRQNETCQREHVEDNYHQEVTTLPPSKFQSYALLFVLFSCVEMLILVILLKCFKRKTFTVAVEEDCMFDLAEVVEKFDSACQYDQEEMFDCQEWLINEDIAVQANVELLEASSQCEDLLWKQDMAIQTDIVPLPEYSDITPANEWADRTLCQLDASATDTNNRLIAKLEVEKLKDESETLQKVLADQITNYDRLEKMYFKLQDKYHTTVKEKNHSNYGGRYDWKY